MNTHSGSAHIVIVEDSRTQAAVLKHLLEQQGYQVTVATNGNDGLAAIRQHKPALVLSDIEMPVLTGYEMCRLVKDDPALRDIPVILLTSLSDPGDVLRGLEAGADYYLTKPCDEEFLLARVAAVLTAREEPEPEQEKMPRQPIEVVFEGERHMVIAGPRQILRLLFSTYANAVQRNGELATAEHRLQDQNKLLHDSAVAERRAHEELKHAQAHLVQSEKLASLGEMVAGVAHEINNPLSFVTNNISVLQRDFTGLRDLVALYQSAGDPFTMTPELAAQIHELHERMDLGYTISNLEGMLQRTTEGLRRIGQIVKDLRDFARLDDGELNAIDLNAGLRMTANIMLTKAHAKSINLEIKLAPLPPVTCYSAKINQVVLNLLSNAIDACTASGTVTLETGVRGSEVQIDVSDNGSGIDPSIRGKIFDPFFTTKPIGQGTGLGLSISYGIVKDHDGTIQVDSAPGKGSRFSVRLPISGPRNAEALAG